MLLSSLALIVTHACNFSCSYCCRRIRKSDFMSWATAETSVSRFFQWSGQKFTLIFTGGEPLLNLSLIEKTVAEARRLNRSGKKQLAFSLTTNGILINENILDFFQHFRFHIVLSFDGLAQDSQRQQGSFQKIVSVIDQMQLRGMDFEVNSVFTPQTVSRLSPSIQFLLDRCIDSINISLDQIQVWNSQSLSDLEKELGKVESMLLKHWREHKNIPVRNFDDTRGKVFTCTAGSDRMAVSPDGITWGCALLPEIYEMSSGNFPDLFYFGPVDRINVPGISDSLHSLSVDHMRSGSRFCFLCKNLHECEICPANAVLAGGGLREVPEHMCRIQKIKGRVLRDFRKKQKSLGPEA